MVSSWEGRFPFCYSTSPNPPLRSEGRWNWGTWGTCTFGIWRNKILTVYPLRCHNPSLQTWFRELRWAGQLPSSAGEWGTGFGRERSIGFRKPKCLDANPNPGDPGPSPPLWTVVGFPGGCVGDSY